MLKTLALAAIALPVLIGPPSMAHAGWLFGDSESEQCGIAPRDEWVPLDAVIADFASRGFQVQGEEAENKCYQITGTDANGARVDLLIDPVNGEAARLDGDD